MGLHGWSDVPFGRECNSVPDVTISFIQRTVRVVFALGFTVFARHILVVLRQKSNVSESQTVDHRETERRERARQPAVHGCPAASRAVNEVPWGSPIGMPVARFRLSISHKYDQSNDFIRWIAAQSSGQ